MGTWWGGAEQARATNGKARVVIPHRIGEPCGDAGSWATEANPTNSLQNEAAISYYTRTASVPSRCCGFAPVALLQRRLLRRLLASPNFTGAHIIIVVDGIYGAQVPGEYAPYL
jgi:hypothetical protein